MERVTVTQLTLTDAKKHSVRYDCNPEDDKAPIITALYLTKAGLLAAGWTTWPKTVTISISAKDD